MNPALITAGGQAIGDLAKAAPGIIDAGQRATETRKWGKQHRKQDQSDWERAKQQEDYLNLLNRNAIEEHLSKTELSEVQEGTSLQGRWNNESRDYNKYKKQVEDELWKTGAIRNENYTEGSGKNAKQKTRTVYDPNIDNKRGELYDKFAGYSMTRDHENKLIGGQSWADVDKKDESILAGELETRKKKNKERAKKIRDVESRFYEAKGDLDSDLLTDDDFKLFGVNNREAFKNKFLKQTVAHSSKDAAKRRRMHGSAYGVNGSASEDNIFM